MKAKREIEAKFLISRLERIRSHLRRLGARLVRRRTHETNIRFDLPDGGLRRGRQVLRLRQDDRVLLTFKGPGRRESGVLNREEIEFTVGDFDLARELLESLGYHPVFQYEKFRTVYRLGRCQVMLDELPYGDFIEIEGPARQEIRSAAEKLALDWDAAIPASYQALFNTLVRRRSRKPKELTFRKFRKARITAEDLGVRPAD